ncbi:MAG: Na+/H+ antiporter NhaA [Campylobacter sputorum]|uniref:Na+/H+ antiporter NhaA n=1 Tax=Campylobacter sputorum TaxID=206 RepID=UPI00053BF874|nr:Na+/H+ antiporter NhaA [Campylobacter sputorum]ASM37840.1 Na+/H+ antiporter [Campylobacter sputorum bv. paraureolyticus LMG 11764]MDY6119861.1 Na+/H+ antiporter NhaA [Campylobacter sputorum]
MNLNIIKKIINNEATGGILIIIATILALIFQNTILSSFYSDFLRLKSGIVIGDYKIIKPIILWVNDGLMAIFFFYIGLEVKREILVGELSTPSKVALPVIGGIGGVIIPAMIFILLNLGDSFALKGWAIPIVSDTAFAIGILLLLKSKFPPALKTFLLLLAIIDDVIAVVIIAVFYTSELSTLALVLATITICFLAYFNFKRANFPLPYIILGLLLWLFFLESGVHSTVAGVITAFFIPLQTKNKTMLLNKIEHTLHPWVTFFIMPIFAFVNAGIALNLEAFKSLLHPVPIGIIIGLLVGKPLGIFAFSYAAIKFKITNLPKDTNYGQFFGLCVLTAIGASMSLFISSIAYEHSDIYNYADKLAILIASFIAAIAGYLIIKANATKEMYN